MAVDVVSGVIVCSGRLLLTQRLVTQAFPFAWGTPGGKVESGESHADALARELWEELRIMMGRLPRTPLHVATVVAPRQGVRSLVQDLRVSFYAVPEPQGPRLAGTLMPSAEERQGLGWFTAEEVYGLTLTPGNTQARDAIVRYMADVR